MKKISYIIGAIGFVITMNSCGVTTPFIVTNNEIGDKVGTSSTICLFSGASQNSASMSPTTGKTVFHGFMLNKNFGIYNIKFSNNILFWRIIIKKIIK